MAKLTYTNSRGESIALGRKTPFFVTNISGFSDVKNIINSVKMPNQDGKTEVSDSLDSRHLVISGEFLYKDRQRGRNKLIQVFNPKLSGVLKYENGSTIKKIYCRPEQTPAISTSTLATVPFIINLFAANPYWQDIIGAKRDIAIWRDNFEFPLELKEVGIELGYREPSLIVNVINEGDVDCGVRIEFEALASVTNPSLFNVNKREFIKINKSMEVGEVITVSTGFQEKRVTSNINGVITNAFNWLDIDSTFLQLDVGDNLLRYDADEGLENLAVTIYYTPQYLGV